MGVRQDLHIPSTMEFASRYKCIEHYQGQFPNLPRYMIEMALDYDLENGAVSAEKAQTGSQRRKSKQVLKAQQKERQEKEDDSTGAAHILKAVASELAARLLARS